MASSYEYRQGTWKQITDPTDGQEETLLSNRLRTLGFIPETTLGQECAHFSIEVYAHSEGNAEGYEYVVLPMTNACLVDLVYIPDLPSYLMFMREMAPLIELTYREKDEE